MTGSGAFLAAEIRPDEGAELTLTIRGAGTRSAVDLAGRVIRLAAAPVPGFALAWLGASSAASARELRQFLRDVLGVDALVWHEGDGRAVWKADGTARVVEAPSPAVRPAAAPPERQAPLGPAPPARPAQKVVSRPGQRRSGAVVRRPKHRADEPSERRVDPRSLGGVEILFQTDTASVCGRIRDISVAGMWVDTADVLPGIGTVVTCRYPLPDDDHDARLVGKVVRAEGGRDNGFAVELLRVDEPECPGAFARHLRERDLRG